jgi:hypothetical protein
MTVRTQLLCVCLLAGLTEVNLPAARITGGFSIAGDMTVTQNTIDWANVNSPFTALPAMIGGDSTGWFSSLDGTTISIDGLTDSTAPVGSDFGPGAFINFDADPAAATWEPADTTSESETWEWSLSAAFDDSPQTAVFDFPANGSITDTFAAIITLTAKPGPDGGYMLGSGLGLILLSLVSRRLSRKHQSKMNERG